MSVKLRCLLQLCLLVCVSACASTNNSQTGVNTTQANSTVSQTTVTTNGGGSNANSVANATAQPPATGIDACSLITTKEVATSQGGAIKEAKSSQRNDSDFLMSQCFYTAEEFVRSVSLSVVQPNPANPAKQPRDYFTEKFRGAQSGGPEGKQEKEREREKAKESKEKAGKERGEEEEDEAQVEPISGLGDQAYWVKTGPSASLYVLKKNQFLILSIGGGDAEPVKLKKTRALAQLALNRMQ